MSNETVDVNEAARNPNASGVLPKRQEGKQEGKLEQQVPLSQKLQQLLARHPKTLVVAWIIGIVAFLVVIPVAYLSWYILPIRLWNWANEQWWHWIPAFFGFCLLFAGPIWTAMGGSYVMNFLAQVSLSIEDAAVHKAQQTVRETEEEAIRRLEQTDAAGLLPLLKYSRAQLEAYYAVGLSQTRRSFLNSVLAMWLGFILLLLGVALYVGPVDKIGLKTPTQDFRILIMGGAAIIEFISALFLWVYRSSTAQLTYFYNRQMHNHTVILCFRIASTMEKADDTKKAIVEKVLDWTTMPERPELVGTTGLRSLLAIGARKAGR